MHTVEGLLRAWEDKKERSVGEIAGAWWFLQWLIEERGFTLKNRYGMPYELGASPKSKDKGD